MDIQEFITSLGATIEDDAINYLLQWSEAEADRIRHGLRYLPPYVKHIDLKTLKPILDEAPSYESEYRNNILENRLNPIRRNGAHFSDDSDE